MDIPISEELELHIEESYMSLRATRDYLDFLENSTIAKPRDLSFFIIREDTGVQYTREYKTFQGALSSSLYFLSKLGDGKDFGYNIVVMKGVRRLFEVSILCELSYKSEIYLTKNNPKPNNLVSKILKLFKINNKK